MKDKEQLEKEFNEFRERLRSLEETKKEISAQIEGLVKEGMAIGAEISHLKTWMAMDLRELDEIED